MLGKTTSKQRPKWVAIAERAKKAGVEEAYFDRGGFLFHGKVKASADAAREGGLKNSNHFAGLGSLQVAPDDPGVCAH